MVQGADSVIIQIKHRWTQIKTDKCKYNFSYLCPSVSICGSISLLFDRQIIECAGLELAASELAGVGADAHIDVGAACRAGMAPPDVLVHHESLSSWRIGLPAPEGSGTIENVMRGAGMRRSFIGGDGCEVGVTGTFRQPKGPPGRLAKKT